MGNKRCPLCGSDKLVRDPVTGALICMECGLVIDDSPMVPERNVSERVAPIDRHFVVLRVPAKEAESAERMARRYVGGDKTEEIVSAIMSVSRHSVSYEELQKAGVLPETPTAERIDRVRAEIESVVTAYCEGVDPDEVFRFAVSNRNLWGGRHSSTIARVFAYIYAKKFGKKCEIKMGQSLQKLARLLERVLV